LLGPSKAELVEVDEPSLRPGSVKVAVEYAGICGSDLGLYQYGGLPAGYRHPIFNEEGPFTLGHEFSGRVTEVGEGVSSVGKGDLVAIRPNVWDGTCAACLRGETNLCEKGGFIGLMGGGGGFSDTVVASEDNVYRLPASFTPQLGAMVESTAVAWHATKVGGVRDGSTVLILGAGPVGLGVLLCARARGAARVIVSELSDTRKQLASELGADVVDPRETDLLAYVREATLGAGADAGFDASGVGAATLGPALDAVRSGGTVVVIARFHGETPIDPNILMNNEKKLAGSLAYTDADFREVIEAIDSGLLDPAPLISSVIPLEETASGGFDLLLGEGRNSEVKILVKP
jgi:threonine dehydrogenase-like Zn-dependent dehydrogenase